MGYETMLTKASTKSNKSLRTTIPIGIVKLSDLSEGYRLFWTIKAENNGLVMVIKPIRKVGG